MVARPVREGNGAAGDKGNLRGGGIHHAAAACDEEQTAEEQDMSEHHIVSYIAQTTPL